MSLIHTYASALEGSYGKDDGTDGQRTAAFLNPMIHAYTSITKSYDTEAHIQKDWVDEVINQQRNVAEGHNKMTLKRKGEVAVYSYYDGLKKITKSTDANLDWSITDHVDNTNLTLYGGTSSLRRYIPEFRIWNKKLSPAEAKQHNNRLRLFPSDPIYGNLIGCRQFHKGEDGRYLRDDPIIVNQIKQVKKRVKAGDREEEQFLDIEGLRLRRKFTISNNKSHRAYVEKEDLKYQTLTNTLYQTIESEGGMMEGVLPVLTVSQWPNTSFPLEIIREIGANAFKTFKLDGVAYPWGGENDRAVWYGIFLGDYTVDLE